MLKMLLAAVAMCAAGTLSAATFTVLNLNDAGAGTLRDAIDQHNTAGGTNTIEFDTGLSGTINLASSLPIISNGDLSIIGPGASTVTVSGDGTVRCFFIANTVFVSVTMSGLTIADGSTTTGAGVYVTVGANTADLTLADCVFTGHQGSAGGAAIYIASDAGTMSTSVNLSVTRCTFSGNTSAIVGGAVAVHNGPFGTTAAGFTNCTFSGNTATTDGGAIHAESGTVTLTNCTFTANTAANGGGVYVNAATVSLRNTIIAANTALGSGPDISGAIVSLDGNLIGDDSDLTMTPQTSDQVGTAASPIDPMLGALADNGGLTPTHALLIGGPAIDAGVTTGAPATDQRGATRDANPDIGAYEFVPPKIGVSHGGSPVTNGGTVILTPDTPAGQARTETVTISNTPLLVDYDLDLSGGVSLSAQTNCTATVTSTPASSVIGGGNTTFDVQITPAAAGAYSVAVSINNNDPVNNPFVFTFTGTVSSAGGDGDGGNDDEGCSTGTGTGFAWLALLGLIAAFTMRRLNPS